MTVEHVRGDLWAQRDVGALAQGVNCVGAMGAGIAKDFRVRFEQMYLAYRDLCRCGGLRPGGLFTWQLPNGRWIYNLASQEALGADARPEALREALTVMLAHAAEHGVASVAMPMIGAGIGGLNPSQVHTIVDEVAAGSPVLVRVVTPPGRR